MLGEIFGEMMIYFQLFGIPVIAVILFVVSLCSYLKAKRREKEAPGSVTQDQLRSRRILTIVLGVIAGFIVLVIVGLLALAYMAIAYM